MTSHKGAATVALCTTLLLLLGVENGQDRFIEDSLKAFLREGWAFQIALCSDLKEKRENVSTLSWETQSDPVPASFYVQTCRATEGSPDLQKGGQVFALFCIWLPMTLRGKLRWSSWAREQGWASPPVSHHEGLMGSRNSLHHPPERERGCTCVRVLDQELGLLSVQLGRVSKRRWVVSWTPSYTWLFSPDLSLLCPASCNARELLPGGTGKHHLETGVSWGCWYDTTHKVA